MSGIFSNSADGLLVLLFVVVTVLFFLFWPHKAYESIFWALIGIGLYVFIHETTFIYPDITRSIYLWDWMIANKVTLLWIAKLTIVGLFFIAPISVGINVAGAVRNTLWFLCKTIILAAFIICFGVVLSSLLSTGTGVFWEAGVLPFSLSDVPYFKNSFLYTWILEKQYVILLVGFWLGLYKILFSHWMWQLVVLSWIMYTKSNAFFWKKKLDSVVSHDDEGGEWDGHEEVHH